MVEVLREFAEKLKAKGFQPVIQPFSQTTTAHDVAIIVDSITTEENILDANAYIMKVLVYPMFYTVSELWFWERVNELLDAIHSLQRERWQTVGVKGIVVNGLRLERTHEGLYYVVEISIGVVRRL